MSPLANFIIGATTLFALLIPILRAINELLKGIGKPKKTPAQLEEQIKTLQTDQDLAQKYIKCAEERERLKLALFNLGFVIVDQ